MEFGIHAEKNHLSFYKNSTNQVFTFISRKVVLRTILHITYSTHKKQFPLPLNVPYRRETIKLAVGIITEPLHT